jgi:hypothetical protein
LQERNSMNWNLSLEAAGNCSEPPPLENYRWSKHLPLEIITALNTQKKLCLLIFKPWSDDIVPSLEKI